MSKKSASWVEHLLGDDQSESDAVRMVEGKNEDPLSSFLRHNANQSDPLYSFMGAFEFGEGVKLDGDQLTGLQALTDSYRAKHALDLPVDAGTKVKFVANTSSLFAYNDPPAHHLEGEVIEVKTATGISTGIDDRVFVKFEDGKLRVIAAEHLDLVTGGTSRQGTLNKNMIRTASLDAFLGEFVKVAEDTLINRSSKDLWSLRKDGDEFVIERLFDDDGNPLMV